MIKKLYAAIIGTINSAMVGITSWKGETILAHGHSAFTRDLMAIFWMIAIAAVILRYIAALIGANTTPNGSAIITINGRRYRARKP